MTESGYSELRRLATLGRSQTEIAREMQLCKTTVQRHLKRLNIVTTCRAGAKAGPANQFAVLPRDTRGYVKSAPEQTRPSAKALAMANPFGITP